MKHYSLRHPISCLPSQIIDIAVDHDLRQVVLTMAMFDSSIVVEVATSTLSEAGVQVVRQDQDFETEAGWLTKPAEYGLRINLAGVLYTSDVVRLLDGEIAVTLAPTR